MNRVTLHRVWKWTWRPRWNLFDDVRIGRVFVIHWGRLAVRVDLNLRGVTHIKAK